MENRMRELERQLGRKTFELEILKEVLHWLRPRKGTLLMGSFQPKVFRCALVASTLGVAPCTVYGRLGGSTKPRGRYAKHDDSQLLPASGRSPRSGPSKATAASRRSSIDSCVRRACADQSQVGLSRLGGAAAAAALYRAA